MLKKKPFTIWCHGLLNSEALGDSVAGAAMAMFPGGDAPAAQADVADAAPKAMESYRA